MIYSDVQLQLLSQLIGLARATDGSEHLINPASLRTVADALICLSAPCEEAVVQQQLRSVIETKREMVPNCFTCAAPCGRTSPFDLSALQEDPVPVQQAKWELLSLLTSAAAGNPSEEIARQFFFLGLIAIGTQPVSEEALFALVNQLRTTL